LSDSTDLLDPGATSAPASDAASSTAEQTTKSTRARAATGGLSAKLLPELQQLAAGLGITGAGRLRKGQLIAAIQTAQGGMGTAPPAQLAPATLGHPVAEQATAAEAPSGPANGEAGPGRTRRRASRSAGAPENEGGRDALPFGEPAAADAPAAGATRPATTGTEPGEARTTGDEGAPGQRPVDRNARRRERPRADGQDGQAPRDGQNAREGRDGQSNREGQSPREGRDNNRDNNRDGQNNREGRDNNRDGQSSREGRDNNRDNNRDGQNNRDGGQNRNRNGQGNSNSNNRFDEEDGSGRRGRFRERRNRRGRQGGGFDETEPVIREDDVLVPVAGILDVLDNYAFVRTSGYLPGPNDVYVSLNLVRRSGLRRGDAVTGAVRQQSDGPPAGTNDRPNKFNALVRLDTVNGQSPEEAKKRPEFMKLTPLYPQDRLRLETEPNIMTTRIIDLVAPIGKGQRGLIVSPPKAGKTMVLQSIANAITQNNPECHLMVVLVDERPEEVTDMQRSVKGEVIASTFDRPPADHTTVAELSIERAKRLVELGHDVVVLLDSITRLGRAYNLAAPASGRILSGGVDSTALYPPKRFLGAARNIENGGSLTILATALVETGSTMDTVIFEEFKGTGNMELKLDRKLAERRVFPAVDVDASGTRKEEILLAPDELRIVLQLRRVLHALDSQQALDLLLDKMKETHTNVEFLLQIAKTSPGSD
jgi:transcription termination factor Rho